jgi:hypothetical protein
MVKLKEMLELKPTGKVKINRIFVNSKNQQMSVILPRKKIKGIPSRIEITYWS